MSDESKMLQALQRAGYKLTSPRRAVVQVLGQALDHVSPAEVYERARELYPHLGLVTVYRTLDVLADLGLVKRVHTEAGCHSYAASSAHGHHHHLVCSDCGTVVEFEGHEDLTVLTESLARRTGFKIEDHWLELFGICPECQGNEKLKVKN